MGLIIQELHYLLCKFMAVHTQSTSSGLILHIVSLYKSFLNIKNQEEVLYFPPL